ncbi:bifunctional 3-demethylubiquinone-9 3-methyltransferase/ 2-octaprenyl-6-hydroxy phenol methylase [Caballeronia arvi]|uniref:Bifunctional 3-demethylubiquinone-9 3-methyltransferase/ 2-octaprenyl-6-hydroxy phenol methylase n=1 Tax=Caballeronia arvi TaxID=1777135 RepID=A0A158JCC6_9BURK|nr:class I SAM-dependent methyltransferase [Caballeronia arvi]SAL66456.1 bifunctional 3-demethylubiquinone-9 3-methyltransferase/ 2-octaprenyl-6-hydroxy phenol methylase [Caballeronia arvi]
MLSFEPELASSGYIFDNALHIWRRDAAETFAYSDGDEVEEALAEILREANDLSVLSPELATHCTDWPRRYHLNAARANLLRPLAQRLTGDILEIGAGCGAISRFLGECGGNVLALEGSQRRASIAALRTRDLSNVIVLNDRFDGFVPTRQFDVVTLIGVLEYAALFGASDDPVQSMLEAVQSMLKPDGILIIAIENQLGLKYLGGAPEDHLGIRMFGVQGLYQKPGVETFGRLELEQRLTAAGYKSIELALPFPDYKLPSSVVLPASRVVHEGFNPEALAAQAATRDAQVNSAVLTFALERVWRTVGRNGLLPDLSNSFLFVASRTEALPSPFEPGALAYHYSVERQPAFCKVTRFVKHDGAVQVLRDSLSYTSAPEHHEFGHHAIHEPLIHGVALDEDFGRLVTTPGWAVKQVADIAHRYVEALFTIAGDRVERPAVFTPDFMFPGDMLDIVPQNILATPDGVPHAIDREWFSHAPLPVGYLLFRALTLMIRGTSTCAIPRELRWLLRRNFYIETFAHLGLDLTQTMIEEYLRREARFMSFALGRDVETIHTSLWLEERLPSELDLQAHITSELAARNDQVSRDLIQSVGQIEEMSRELAQIGEHRDDLSRQIDEFAHRNQELEVQVQELGVQVGMARTAERASRDKLDSVINSTTWRATQPIRSVFGRIKRLSK